MSDLSRTETVEVVDKTGKYSTVVINALRSDRDMRMRAIRLIESDIARAQEAIEVAKRAKTYIVEAIRADNTPSSPE